MHRYNINLSIVLVLILYSVTPAIAQQSEYVGEEHRGIKTLSEKEIEQYLSGAGMGFAKAAELNHYPGPKHVLDLADTLGISAEKKSVLEKIYVEMKANAIQAGKQILENEKVLNDAFSAGTISLTQLEHVTNKIGALQAKLRFTHLRAHLVTKSLMTKHQIHLYDQLRGYYSDKVHEH